MASVKSYDRDSVSRYGTNLARKQHDLLVTSHFLKWN